MKLTAEEYTQLIDKVKQVLKQLDETGVDAAILSISCDTEELGWSSDHFKIGNPLTGKALAEEYLELYDDEDGEFVTIMQGPGGE
jgi:uncharacterized protein YbbK (DUF523 family)